MRSIAYHLLDVFTDRPFGGNQLAVFLDAPILADDVMQRIARELNLSETVFVRPSADGSTAWDLRIYTPGGEVPFAGHPTAGTAILLAMTGRITAVREGRAAFVLGERAGPVACVVTGLDTDTPHAEFTAPQRPSYGPPTPSPDEFARVLGLGADAIGLGTMHPRQVSCGLAYTIVPVRDRDALGRVQLDLGAWARIIAPLWAPLVYVVTPGDGAAAWQARMFAPALGVPEDPATGSAAAAFAGYLATTDGTHAWTIAQGVEMGRPSRISIAADRVSGVVTAVRVGGTAVLMGEGTLRIA
jgi:trans-2,3-dihydro-3-hydroxyanthranilate isomerase